MSGENLAKFLLGTLDRVRERALAAKEPYRSIYCCTAHMVSSAKIEFEFVCTVCNVS